MSRINKPGQHIRLPDGREGTTVFNGLTGVGIKWGIHQLEIKDFEGTAGDAFAFDVPDDFQWQPDAMLREPAMSEKFGMECVGEDYEFID